MSERTELKYIVGVEDFLRLRRSLESVLVPDTHMEPGGYLVRSLYFDSLYDRDVRMVEDGILEKGKIRIRLYDPEIPRARLEYKIRRQTRGKKLGLDLTREEVRRLESMDYSVLENRPEPFADIIRARMMMWAYCPKTIVQYRRTAYVFAPGDIRITFDRDLRTSASPAGLWDRDPCPIPILPPDTGVLEVKSRDVMPSLIRQLLAPLDSLPGASSKYAMARRWN